MKKYDWDKQLRRGLNALPEDERETVLDYYNEIFEDKRDRGERETEIIASFGSPYAVAEKILKESRSGGTFRGDAGVSSGSSAIRAQNDGFGFRAAEFSEASGETRPYHPSKKIPSEPRAAEFTVADGETKNGGGRVALFIVLLILLWIPILTVSVSVFAILFALVAAFAALIAAGGYIAVLGFIDAAAGAGAAAGLVEIGAGILVVGIGFLLCPLCLWFGKIVWRLLRSACGAIGKWLRGRKAA